MAIFAIGDLHLSGSGEKPMHVFGRHWEHHFDRIRESWRQSIGSSDIVLIPGDISWAMQFEEAKPDLNSIAELPGIKILLRGNHADIGISRRMASGRLLTLFEGK